jgi:hypothetical protein
MFGLQVNSLGRRVSPRTNLGPTLSLNFTSGSALDPRITFTRTTTATRINASGVIESAAINAPRFDYDPVTLAPKGLMIESQRTNLLLNSNTLSTQNVTVTAVSSTLSFYGTGTVVLSGVYTGTLVGSGAYPTRSTLTFTPTAGTLTLTVTGTVQFAQLEAGAFATSYIPTVASQVTRTPDVAYMSGTNFTSWYNFNEGTIYTEASAPSVSGAYTVCSVNDTTNSNRTLELSFTTNKIRSINVISSVATSVTSANTVSGSVKMATAIKNNDFALSINGLTAVTNSSVTMTTAVSGFAIWSGSYGVSATPLIGTIKQITYYPRRLTNAELQAITS